MTTLEVKDLTAGYGDLTVIRGASLVIPPASITAILGRNGAGKSTLLKAIAGLLPIRSGQILLDGEPLEREAAHRRRSRGIGYVQENKRIFKRRSVEENLLLGGYSQNLDRSALEEQLELAYGRFPILREKRDQRAGYLSGGQQQMLAISQALIGGPRLIILDEPSSGLAPSITNEVMTAVGRLRDEEGMTVLLVEQVVESTLRVSDYVAVLDVGRVVHEARSTDAGIREAIRDAYLGAGGAAPALG